MDEGNGSPAIGDPASSWSPIDGPDYANDEMRHFHIARASSEMPDDDYEALLNARVSEAGIALNILMDCGQSG